MARTPWLPVRFQRAHFHNRWLPRPRKCQQIRYSNRISVRLSFSTTYSASTTTVACCTRLYHRPQENTTNWCSKLLNKHMAYSLLLPPSLEATMSFRMSYTISFLIIRISTIKPSPQTPLTIQPEQNPLTSTSVFTPQRVHPYPSEPRVPSPSIRTNFPQF